MAAYEIEPCILVFQCVRIKNKVCNALVRSSALRKGMVAKKILRSKLYLAGFLVGCLRLRRYLSVARRFNLSLSVPHTAGHSRRLA